MPQVNLGTRDRLELLGFLVTSQTTMSLTVHRQPDGSCTIAPGT